VKAYPNPSISYGETVCCAGIDLDATEWVRLWPIPFRDLDREKQFKKYDIIMVKCAKASADRRPESFKIIPTSINILERIDTKNSWQRRKKIVFSLPLKTQCEVEKESIEKDPSLGIIKPERISFSIKQRPKSSPEKRRACYAQLGLFVPKKDPIEEIPYIFYYEFFCAGISACPGHKLPILDWEIGQAYRNFRINANNEDDLLNQIRIKWLQLIDTSKRDVHFFTGNQLRFRDQFAVLGVFWPPLNDESSG